MKRLIVFFAVLLLTACTSTAPTCIDLNSNKICDSDETTPEPVVAESTSIEAPLPEPRVLPNSTAVQKAAKIVFGEKIVFNKDRLVDFKNYYEDVNNTDYDFYDSVPATIIEITNPAKEINDTSAFHAFMQRYARKRYDRLLITSAELLNVTKYNDSQINNSEWLLKPSYKAKPLEVNPRFYSFEYLMYIYDVRYNSKGNSFERIVSPIAGDLIYAYCTPKHVVALYYTGSSGTGANWEIKDEEEQRKLIEEQFRGEQNVLVRKGELLLAECDKLLQ